MLQAIETIWIIFLVLVGAFLLLGLIGGFLDLGSVLKQALTPWRRPKEPPKIATVTRAFSQAPGAETATGKVELDGAVWDAECATSDARHLTPGDKVEVEDIDGLVVKVRRHNSIAV